MSTENRIEDIHLPQPDEVSEKDREYAFGAYIMMFAGAYFPLPFVEIISSFIYYVYYKKRSRYAAFHAYQSCLSQLPITVVNTGYAAFVIVWLVKSIRADYFDPSDNKLVLIFLGITIIINIIYIIVSLSIAFKAKKGIFRYFPIVGKIAFEKFYGTEAAEIEKPELLSGGRNRPPE
jgi:uncharacterized membrane protein